MDRVDRLEVHYHERKVGTLARYRGQLAAFEYDKEWIANSFTIIPEISHIYLKKRKADGYYPRHMI